MVFTTDTGGHKLDQNGQQGEPVVLKLQPHDTSLHMGKEGSVNGSTTVNGSTATLYTSKTTFSSFEEDIEKPPVSLKDHVKGCCLGLFSLDTLKSRLPIIVWLPKYNFFNFQCDLIAGVTVGLTVIPQGLAYAGIAGLPPQYGLYRLCTLPRTQYGLYHLCTLPPTQYGLYSAFMCTFVYCVMGSAKDITLGPSAIVSLITASFATSISPRLPNGDVDPTMAIILPLTSGIIFVVMAAFKLGIIVSFISFPVINAFSSAAAITIAVSQLKTLLGLKGVPNDFIESLDVIRKKLPYVNVWDMTMGLSSIVVVILLKKLREIKWKNDPEKPPSGFVMFLRRCIFISGAGSTAIVVVLCAGILAILEFYGNKSLTPTGYIKPGMPEIRIPDFSIHIGNYTMSEAEVFGKLGAGIIIVPIIALIEAMAIGKYFARINQYKLDPTQELFAYGVGNIITAFFQGYTITGTFSRTAINSQCGVKTPLGGVFTGAIVIISLYFLTPLFYYIPKCALAGVIIAAVLAMVDLQTLRMLYKANKLDLFPYLITFICTLLIGIQWGIFVGIGVSIFILLYPISRPKILFSTVQGFLIVTPLHGLNFPGAEYLEIKALDRALGVEKPHNIILNMEHLSNMDFSAVQSLRSLMVECEFHGMRLVLAQGQKRVRRQLKQAKIKNLIVVRTIEEAIDVYTVLPIQDTHKEITVRDPTDDPNDEGYYMSRL
ncbi:unnamed protein product [Lymnaea stagnalis]|uniref:STAS domain-containing protein n=1 Tax=Lymnaea stagnalis TaxID=6523 RepID=A0AAV2I1V7_LYMST